MTEVPSLILAAAIGPAVLWGLGVVAGLGSLRADWRSAGLCFAAGALLSAPAASWCSSQVGPALGLPLAVVAAIVAPLVEEFLKGVAVAVVAWWTLGGGATARGWIRCGLCVGLGFTATENTQYLLLASLQGGEPGLWRGVFVRGFAWGMHHAVFTALVAVAIHRAGRSPSDLRGAVAWGAGAVSLHVLWNSVVAAGLVDMICAAPDAGGPCRWPPGAVELFLLTPVVSLLAVSPGLLALRVAWTRAGERPSPRPRNLEARPS